MTRAEIKARAKYQLGGNIFSNAWMMALLVCVILSAVSMAAGTVVPAVGALVVCGPMSYGVFYVFLKQSRDLEPIKLTDVFKGFTDCFGDSFLIGLMTSIFTILWSLLFVIPGIVKAYAYSMAYYVKIDHPDYDWNMCITESRRIMKGNKGKLFVQDLSFIGWYIVGSLVLGFGTLWVVPYHIAANAQFYESIKNGTQVL